MINYHHRESDTVANSAISIQANFLSIFTPKILPNNELKPNLLV